MSWISTKKFSQIFKLFFFFFDNQIFTNLFYLVHLRRCHSDHCPVLLEMIPREARRRERPFMFQTGWLSDVTFPKVVS